MALRFRVVILAAALSGCLVSEKVIRNGRTATPPQDSVAYKETDRPDSIRVLMIEISNAEAAIADWLETAKGRRDPIRINCLADQQKAIKPVVAAAKKAEADASAATATPEYASYQLKQLQDIWTQAQTIRSRARACPDSQILDVREVESIKVIRPGDRKD